MQTKRRILGIFLAILFAIVASIPWIVIGYFGWVASLAGYLIGLGAYKGYTIGNTTFDKFGQLTVLVIILLAVPFAEMVNTFIAAMEYVNFTKALEVTPTLFFYYIGDYIPAILLGYLMAALGTYQFILPNKKVRIRL